MRNGPGAAALLIVAAACSSRPGAADNEAAAPIAPTATQAATPTPPPPTPPPPTSTPSPAHRIVSAAGAGAPAVPGSGAPRPQTSLPEGPFAPDSAQGGADVVQTYYALLGERRFDRAYRLWDRGGDASGQSEAGFAAGFAKYRDYRARVGGPGDIEGAAGSRYVAVPVRITATSSASGREMVQDGTVTLRRVGEVDGATAAQKRWHIATIDLEPAKGQRPR